MLNMLSCFDTVGFLEGFEVGALHIDLATSLDEGNALLITVALKSSSAHVEFLAHLLAAEVFFILNPEIFDGIELPVLVKCLGHQGLQLRFCYEVNFLHFFALRV